MIGKILSFIKSPIGMTLVFVGGVMVCVYFLAEHRERQAREPKQRTSASASLGQLQPHRSQLEQGKEWERIEGEGQLPEWAERSGYEPFTPAPPEKAPPPSSARMQPATVPAILPKILHVSYSIQEKEPALPEIEMRPRVFAPKGTLIPCELLLTVESGSARAPVIGLITEDIYHNGNLIVAANTEVHGPGSAKRRRDRVLIDGNWSLIFADGRALEINATALQRSFDLDMETYGVDDGSLGIKGTLEETVEHHELKLIASTAIGALTRSQKESVRSIFGSVPDNTLSNGLLEGGASVADLYAKRLLEDTEGDGRFVRVPAGAEFYLYSRDMIDPGKAIISTRKSGADPGEAQQRGENHLINSRSQNLN